MRILIITQIYLPEMGALSNRLYPIVRELAAAGHRIWIATGMPNYPAGKVFPAYRGKLSVRERQKDCEVIRTAYYTVPRNRSKVTQLLSYLSFMPAVLLSVLRSGKPDVVFVTSPPVFPIIPAIIASRLRGTPLVLDVRDLWSDELVTYNNNRQASPSIRLIRALERWGYRASNLIGCTTNSIMETVIERGAAAEKTFYFPNGADLELFEPLPRLNPIADGYGFGDKFVVMYSGLFGIKHGLEVLLEAAKQMRDMDDIVFFLVGDGARRNALQQFVRDNALKNVIISGERPVEEIPHILARADICFAACRPEPYPKKLISVKIFEYLACERPVVGAFEGESARILEESGGGIVVRPGDAVGIVNAILKLRNDRTLRETAGRRGREYVEQNFSRGTWAANFERLLSNHIKLGATGEQHTASSADIGAISR